MQRAAYEYPGIAHGNQFGVVAGLEGLPNTYIKVYEGPDVTHAHQSNIPEGLLRIIANRQQSKNSCGVHSETNEHLRYYSWTLIISTQRSFCI